jgi:hypothetical protein
MRRFVAILLATTALTFAHGVDAKERRPAIAFEIAPPPPSFGTDAAGLRTVVQDEMKKAKALPRNQKRVVISLSLKETKSTPVACSVNATIRDARTGAVLAIIETGAHASGPVSPELKKELAYTVVRDAVRRVPTALGARK